MKHLHLAMQINVPNNMVCAIEYGSKGEYGLNEHELTMLERLRNEKLNHCYNAIYDWGRSADMQPDRLFQINTRLDIPCTVLKVWVPIPHGINNLYKRMNKIAKRTIHSYMYDWSVYDTHTLFSNKPGTPFLWRVGRCGTHLGMMNVQQSVEYAIKYADKHVIESFEKDNTWMDAVFSTCCFSSDDHAYYYNGKRLIEVSRVMALAIWHEFNQKVVETYYEQTKKAA